jgi:hypothetical protein
LNRVRQLIVFAWAFMLAKSSLAETSVVIVVPHPGTAEVQAFEHRLRSELMAAGFQPVSVEVAVEITPPVIRNAAIKLMSHAALSLAVHDGLVSGLVWIEGRGNGEDSYRPIPEYPISAHAPTVFAVRATDVLHGGLLELGYMGPATPAKDPQAGAATPMLRNTPPTSAKEGPSVAVLHPVEPHRRSSVREQTPPPPKPPKAGRASDGTHELKPWQLNVWTMLAKHVLAFPTSVGLAATATRRSDAHWNYGAAVGVFAPVTSTTAAGRATILQSYLGPRLEWRGEVGESVDWFGYAESGLHGTWVSSEATRAFVAHDRHSLTGYSAAGFGMYWLPRGAFGLSAATGLQLPWRRSDIIVADATVAEAAGLALQVNLGLSLRL